MRKAQVKQLQDMVKILYEAADEIKKSIKNKKIEMAQTLLADSQDAAIQMGKFIEGIEGEECVTIGYLEDFCDELVNVYNRLNEIIENKAYKLLHRAILKIENSINNDIKIIKEVVFLPYKASMWDSLESIWKAADEDENCNAVVIPIPYFDRNPDLTLGTAHYEGAEFPEYVPITDWRKYDLKEQRPDEIYIHNPYDDCNRVTCVSPMFFSKNLQNYTDMLVYVPYFVLAEIEPDNQIAIDGMKHFITTPGVLNAHRVIVQSEKMRQIYINELIKYTGYDDRKYWEKKVLGTGSPKFDKVANTKKEDVDVPEEWLKIIKKPNGENKKVIFYNTGLSALLQHNEKMIEKIRDVLRVFYENKDDVALLWRPHPLIKATIESMRPQLWEAYKEIVDKYVADGWGIYDDTPDLNRAIAISDAYYGDGSSVVQLCQKAGIPVMRQNVQVHSENCNTENLKFWPSAFCVVDDDIWFVYGHICLLCKYNLKTHQTEIISQIPVKDIYRECLFLNINFYNNKLYLIPAWADSFVVYDIDNKDFSEIELPQKIEGLKFEKTYVVNDRIYCIPYSYPAIVEINPDNQKITDIFNLHSIMKSHNITMYHASVMVDKNTVAMVGLDTNHILMYNIKDKCNTIINVGSENNKYNYIAYIDDILYLSDNYSNQVVCYSIKYGKIIDSWWPGEQSKIAIKNFGSDKLLVNSYTLPWIGCYKCDFHVVFEEISDFSDGRSMYSNYLTCECKDYKDTVYYFNNADSSLTICCSDKKNRLHMYFTEQQLKYLEELEFKNSDFIKEDDIVSLKTFLSKESTSKINDSKIIFGTIINNSICEI